MPIIHIKVVPNSSKSEICLKDSEIKIKIKAKPIDNLANEELIRFLSKEFKIAKSDIKILKGHTSKYKTIELPLIPKSLVNNP